MPPEPFLSYAQNWEDVVLWRALGHVEGGTYVDVGAASPDDDSVTKAFYERGWRGVNVEPVSELAQALRAARPEDVTFEGAAGAEAGTLVLHAVPGTGLSTLVSDVAEQAVLQGHDVLERVVAVRTLDDILAEAGFDDRLIHFCKIDVEGFETDVLRGFDLARWRPLVLVVESTRPNSTEQTHASWEHLVIDAGYRLCLFDGLNRFYLADGNEDLAAALGAPANVLDMPFARAPEHRQLQDLVGSSEQLNGDLGDALVRIAEGEQRVALLTADAARWRQRSDAARQDSMAWRAMALRHGVAALEWGSLAATLNQELTATLGTVSWRVTAPLRRARRKQGALKQHAARLRRSSSTTPEEGPDAVVATPEPGPKPWQPSEAGWSNVERALGMRLAQATALLAPGAGLDSDDPAVAMAAFEEVLRTRAIAPAKAAWLAHVAVTARYPTEPEQERAVRILGLDGPATLLRVLWAEFAPVLASGAAPLHRLDIIDEGVVVDVTHTASHHLHTGVQRVVRETVTRWLDHQRIRLVGWDYALGAPSPITAADIVRFRAWREHLQVGGEHELIRVPDYEPSVVVPWSSTFVFPEIAGEPQRTEGYRTLARSGVASRLSAICYDLIPVTIRETVISGLAEAFTDYLTVVKHCHRVSAISESCAHEFQAFSAMMAAQGLPGPVVVGHPLPTDAPVLTDAEIDDVRQLLDLDHTPMVLVVGSHEPRKNHLAVLLAAEQLWRAGHVFHLVFIGGSSWKSEPFHQFVDELRAAGRPIQIVRRASEETLWGAYRLARFTVFPSLAEGFGLPVAESLVSGTPAVTSDYGSLAEIALGGGTLTVDPRDARAIEQAMLSLLDDDAVLDRLRDEAVARRWKTWDDYAKETWDHLVAG